MSDTSAATMTDSVSAETNSPTAMHMAPRRKRPRSPVPTVCHSMAEPPFIPFAKKERMTGKTATIPIETPGARPGEAAAPA